MQNPALILALSLLPAIVQAQDWGERAVQLDYTRMSLMGTGGGGADPVIYHLVPVPGLGFLEYNCGPSDEDDCFVIQYLHYPNAVAFGNVPLDMPPADALALLSPITTRDYQGDTFFPPVDGATATWVEVWDTEDFQAEYQMRAEMTCCVAPSGLGISEADALWTMVFSYDNSGEVGDPHAGTISQLYDAELGAFTVVNTSNWYIDETDIILSSQVLLGLSARPD